MIFCIYFYLAAEEILRDEQKKKPCAKFPIGNCQFGAMCRFSHYTPEELATINAKGKATFLNKIYENMYLS